MADTTETPWRKAVPSREGETGSGRGLRVAIVGTGKSGTTALYYRLLHSMPENTTGSFEPAGIEALRSALRQDKPTLLVKLLLPLTPEVEDMLREEFDKRILLIRDPRDVVISILLYTSAYEFLWKRDTKDICAVIGLLRQKERDKNAVSVLQLLERMRDDFVRQEKVQLDPLVRELRELAVANNDYFLLRYEDMIAGDLRALEQYLGFPVSGDDSVAPEHRRVVRTRGSGSWRFWFCPEDVAYFRPRLAPAMTTPFEYDDDWRIEPQGRIDAAVSSEYVLRVLNERRLEAGLQPISCA